MIEPLYFQIFELFFKEYEHINYNYSENLIIPYQHSIFMDLLHLETNVYFTKDFKLKSPNFSIVSHTVHLS